ncbi:MAG: ATP-dependent helicase, partial [Firmicutes bacterium]|nr:ATP-dependent helicase [Bacillota bacterium]
MIDNDVYNILNDEQKAALAETEGPVLVTAGAGSGKTRLLTCRIAKIVENGTPPFRVLAITFTNKAAGEMRERLERMLPDTRGMWIMTIHAMCARILRGDIERLGGYTSNFSIYGEPERDRLIKRILKDAGLDEDKLFKVCKNAVSDIKGKFSDFDEYKKVCGFMSHFRQIERVYIEYEDAMRKGNALDYDDLLLLTYRLLAGDAEVRQKYQERFNYIHVDEFQDTAKIQYGIIRMLAGKHRNIFIVGDEDQSIYGWRGASLDNLTEFVSDFLPAVFKLERNYRSTKKILEAANNVIANNTGRIPKVLYTANDEGVRVECYSARDELGEAEYVASAIYGLKRHGYGLRDIAVLCRLNALTRSFEERFMYYSLPYRVFGGFKFYDRKEIKDLLAYMRAAVNPYDD